jgi:hypothetical protein
MFGLAFNFHIYPLALRFEMYFAFFKYICFKLSFYFFEFELHLDIFNIILRVITC